MVFSLFTVMTYSVAYTQGEKDTKQRIENRSRDRAVDLMERGEMGSTDQDLANVEYIIWGESQL